jgi:hypothetical protein
MRWRRMGIPRPFMSREKNLLLILLAFLIAFIFWSSFWLLARMAIFLVVVYLIYLLLRSRL